MTAWQLLGAALAALGSWLAFLSIEWIYPSFILAPALSMSLTNGESVRELTPVEKATRKFAPPSQPVSLRGFAAFIVGALTGIAVRVMRDGASPTDAAVIGGIIVVGAAVMTAVIAHAQRGLSARAREPEQSDRADRGR